MKKWTKAIVIVGVSVTVGILTGVTIGTYLGDNSDENIINTVKGKEVNVAVDSDKHIADVMHQMTHQKVMSNNKQGFIKMTPDNIKKLQKVIEDSTPGGMKNKGKYIMILDRWEHGDFSQAVEEHNYMRDYMRAQIGGSDDEKAERLATPEEEYNFLKEQAKKERNKGA
ncbi:DUF6241 domain-containing protein [Bacillus sp. C1]